MTAELKIQGIRYYQELIGVLRWAIELGRVDIAMEVSMLSSHLAALPREGHLQQVYHIFGVLKAKPKRTLAFDPQHPDIDENRFVKCDWHDFYRGTAESKKTHIYFTCCCDARDYQHTSHTVRHYPVVGSVTHFWDTRSTEVTSPGPDP